MNKQVRNHPNLKITKNFFLNNILYYYFMNRICYISANIDQYKIIHFDF